MIAQLPPATADSRLINPAAHFILPAQAAKAAASLLATF